MNSNLKPGEGILQKESLKFSGKVTASISHDLKNVLAIINENAGLMQDISSMMEEGFVLSPQRLNTISQKIENQVSRANDIIFRLNKFAHSVDEEIVEFEIFEILEIITKIFDRIGKLKGLKVELVKPPEAYRVNENLFYFQYLIWHCLEFLSKNINQETRLEISINFENKTYYIICKLSEEIFNDEEWEAFKIYIKQTLEFFNGQLLTGSEKQSFKLAISI